MNEFKRICKLDLRSIALMRIGVATVLIWDLIDRLLQFQFFYAIDGVIPFSSSEEYYSGMATWSFHLLIESDIYQYSLFGLHLLLAIALLFGFHAQKAAIGCWLLFASLIARAPVLLTGGDMLMSSMLFWLMWIPSGHFLSFKKRGLPVQVSITGFATAGILLQFVVMYTLTGVYKWNPEWHDGTALFVIMDDQALTKPLGIWLTQYPGLLKLLTWGTLALELAAPVLLLSPVATDRFRGVAVMAFVGLHAGIFFTMEVLGFSPISIAGLMAFIPATAWNLKPFRKFNSIQEAGQDSLPTEDSSQRTRSFKLSSVLRESGAALGLCMMLFFAVWQMLIHAGKAKFNPQINRIVHHLRMDQTWTMFHIPSNLCYRYLLEGRTADGKFIDLLRGNQTRTNLDDRPEIPEPPIRFESSRWLLLYRQMGTNQYANQQLHTIRHLLLHNPAAADLPTAEELDVKEVVFHGAAGTRDIRAESTLLLISHVDFRAKGGYHAGQPHGAWEHYRDSGALDSKGPYEHGLRHGKWQFYHSNGQLASEGNFDLGHEHGFWTMFDEDGNRTAYGEFIDGQKEGTWTFWYDNGGMSTGKFKDDELVENQDP